MIGHALDSPFEIPDIPLRATSLVFDEVGLNQLSVQLAVEIDVRGLGFKEEADRANDALAFLIEAQHRESGEYYRYDQKIELSLLPQTRRKLEQSWYPVAREFTLPPGALPGQDRGARPQHRPGGLTGARVRGARGRAPARLEPVAERRHRDRRRRHEEAGAAGASPVRARRPALLPVRRVRRRARREGLADAEGEPPATRSAAATAPSSSARTRRPSTRPRSARCCASTASRCRARRPATTSWCSRSGTSSRARRSKCASRSPIVS